MLRRFYGRSSGCKKLNIDRILEMADGGDEFLQAKRLEEEIKKNSAQNFDSDGKSDRSSSGHVQKKIRKDSKRDI